jgi:hypothetical protein
MNPDAITLPANTDAERSILGGILLDNCLQGQAGAELLPEHFFLDSHRKIYSAMAELAVAGKPIDLISIAEELNRRKELESAGGVAYLTSLTDGVPRRQSIEHYVRLVKEKASLRGAIKGAQQLIASIGDGGNLKLAEEWTTAILDRIHSGAASSDWRDLFHTYEEFEKAPVLQEAITKILPEAGVTLLGGLAGHGKTLVMLSMVKALLTGKPLFGHEQFTVPRKADRVLYLIPEATLQQFWPRLQAFHLSEFVRNGQLFVRTLSAPVDVTLTDSRMLHAAKGAVVFLDTAIRFFEGAENDAENSKAFANTLFAMLRAGARTVVGAHHAPKSFESQDHMTLENVLRGSGDIGAMLSGAWGLRQVDRDKTRIYVENIKARDIEPCGPFVLEGRPWIDFDGDFRIVEAPGEAGDLREYLQTKGGRPAMKDQEKKLKQAIDMQKNGRSLREIADDLGVSKSTVERWVKTLGETDSMTVATRE